MPQIVLEHINFTVRDAKATAPELCELFDWKVRWHGSAMDGLGETWLFEQVSHKFHACCHGLHAALEAAAELVPTDPDGITAIEVTTHPRWLTVCNIAEPKTGLEAKFSYAQVMALAALGHDTTKIFLGTQQTSHGFSHIDDVNEILACVDIGSHLGVPTFGLVAEVNACFEQ